MCGIAGIVDFARPVDPDEAEAMADLIAHRGPDDRGLYAGPDAALAHLRLSILDLSAAGRQPMADPSGRYHLLLNGEVYNYVELRSELRAHGHRFSTDTDTEVVLAAYAEWGERCVERFRGMWALALWDARERSLFCSRDRFGIKPFYYWRRGSSLLFASELKAFAACRGWAPAPDERVVRDYLAYARLEHDAETFFHSVLRLPAAHCLRFDRAGLRVVRYWSLDPAEPPAGSQTEAVREAFFESLRLHLRSDVPVGTCLSGGIDSSAVACGVARLLSTSDAALAVGERQRTFTAYFAEVDERPWAEAVVRQTGAQPHWVTFDVETLLADLDRIVWAQDEPFGSPSMVAQYYVMRAARDAGVKVVLDGQGADEVFAGYRTVFGPRLRDLLATGRLRAFARDAASVRSLHGIAALSLVRAVVRATAPAPIVDRARAHRTGAGALLHPRLAALPHGGRPEAPRFRDALRRHLEDLLVRSQLPELLRYEDRNSMAHSLEARVPFLDHRLVELAFSLPGDQLVQDGVTKLVLRRALSDLLPEIVAARRDKVGFGTPHAAWFRGRLGELAADVLSSPAAADRGLVDVAAARKQLDLHRRGVRRAGFELWRALNIELWARAFLDRPAPSRDRAERRRAPTTSVGLTGASS